MFSIWGLCAGQFTNNITEANHRLLKELVFCRRVPRNLLEWLYGLLDYDHRIFLRICNGAHQRAGCSKWKRTQTTVNKIKALIDVRRYETQRYGELIYVQRIDEAGHGRHNFNVERHQCDCGFFVYHQYVFARFESIMVLL